MRNGWRGKTAVITGGSRGIGLAIARALLREGCSVVITGRDRARLADATKSLQATYPTTSDAKILGQECDVCDERSVKKLFAVVKQRFGRLDILVNNAGISQAVTSVAQTSLKLWKEVLDTNLTGTFLCTREALPLLPRGGTIVNILSVAAKKNFPNFAAYNASKRGALGFTLTLREELIPRGIRVVALLPGATATDIWQQFWPDAPRERMVDVESVAQAVLYAVLLPAQANLSELVLEPVSGPL